MSVVICSCCAKAMDLDICDDWCIDENNEYLCDDCHNGREELLIKRGKEDGA